jgi:hypothetical protein
MSSCVAFRSAREEVRQIESKRMPVFGAANHSRYPLDLFAYGRVYHRLDSPFILRRFDALLSCGGVKLLSHLLGNLFTGTGRNYKGEVVFPSPAQVKS